MNTQPEYTPASAQGEFCTICGSPAQRKIEEVIFDDDPLPMRHPFVAYLCIDHFKKVMNLK